MRCGGLIDQLSDPEWIVWTEQNPEDGDVLWTAVEAKLKEPWIEGIPQAEYFLETAESLRDDPESLDGFLKSLKHYQHPEENDDGEEER